MEEQLEQSKRCLHFCMALIGGWFGAYAILRFHHFASAVTVNFIEIFTSAVQENWIKALLRMGIVILYVFTIFLAACLSKRCKGDLRMWAILSDAAAACVLSVLPERLSELGVYICIFAMGFQWCVFAGKYGYPCSTIFSTNNLRQFVDAWVQAHLFRDSDHIPRMNLYGGTLLAFHAGVIAECVLWAMGWEAARSCLFCFLRPWLLCGSIRISGCGKGSKKPLNPIILPDLSGLVKTAGPLLYKRSKINLFFR